jgi:hypothetical protein
MWRRLIWFFVFILLCNCVIAGWYIVDDFNRANSEYLGEALNGNVWEEVEHAQVKWSINENHLRFFREIQGSYRANLSLSSNLTNGEKIKLVRVNNTYGEDINILTLLDGNTVVFQLGYDGNCFKNHSGNIFADTCLYTPPQDVWIFNITFIMHLDNNTVTILFNETNNANSRFINQNPSFITRIDFRADGVTNNTVSSILFIDEIQAFNNTTPFAGLVDDDAWCISCEPDQKLDNQPFETDDLTPTINATLNESGTCAIIADNTGAVPNYNYTDILTNGGVECSTTGGINQLCTVQSSNAFTAGSNKYLCVGCKDSEDNELTNATFCAEMDIAKTNFSLYLDGLNESRKYEFNSLVNLTANCSSVSVVTCNVCINLSAPNYGGNYSCGENYTSFIYNISVLRQENFSKIGKSFTLSSSGQANISMDTNAILVKSNLNITSSGTTENLNITYTGGGKKELRGDLLTEYLLQTDFIHSGSYKRVVNLTYTTGGSNYIYVNLSKNVKNLTFEIRGFDLDIDNKFKYTEHFNGTDGSYGFNGSLSSETNSPLWVFDEFAYNNTNWSISDAGSDIQGIVSLNYSYEDNYLHLHLTVRDDCTPTTYTWFNDYSNEIADLRNTSRVEILLNQRAFAQTISGISALSRTEIYASDGSSNVILKNWEEDEGTIEGFRNITLIKKSGDYSVWEVLMNGTTQGQKDISSLDFEKQIKLRFKAYVMAGGACVGVPSQNNAEATIDLYEIKWGGSGLKRNTTNGTYYSIGNMAFCLAATEKNISRMTLTTTDYIPAGTSIHYYLSNTGNSSNPEFEEVLSGFPHVFNTIGNKPCVRAKLNSTINTTTPIIKKMTVEVLPSTIENISIDLGDDGTTDWSWMDRLNSTTSPKLVNFSRFPVGYTTIKISSTTAGTVEISNFRLNTSINPVELNYTILDTCSNCEINFSFGGDSITVSGLEFDFYGSWNYTTTAWSPDVEVQDAKTIQIYYSDFNVSLPKDVFWYDVFAPSKNATNISPYKQTDKTPIWNVSNLAYDEPIDIYVKTNETISCLNVTYSNESNISSPTSTTFILNQSYQKILSNISISSSKGIWNYWNLYDCPNIFEIPYVFFSAICTDCYFDDTQLDYYRIIEE